MRVDIVNGRPLWLGLVLPCLLLTACDDAGSEPSCAPGDTTICQCTDGSQGLATCGADGSFGPCLRDGGVCVEFVVGGDEGPSDTGSGDVGRPDTAPGDTGGDASPIGDPEVDAEADPEPDPVDTVETFDCASEPDGTDCGMGAEGFICLGGLCVASFCGDGFVAEALGEECEDGNFIPYDGCEANCTFTCSTNVDCQDDSFCNGEEVCSESNHTCGNVPPLADDTECTVPDSLPGDPLGRCLGGVCLPPGCGDGIVQVGEDCDDENMIDGDGCDNDCRWSCEVAGDCDDRNVCTGVETCDNATHTCQAGEALVCPEGEAVQDCYEYLCDPIDGCYKELLVDEDGDGFPPQSEPPYTTCTDFAGGYDCNDDEELAYPGAFEIHPDCEEDPEDPIDHDCDGDFADGTPPECCLDVDGDLYGNEFVCEDVCAPECPEGYVRTPKQDGESLYDCLDREAGGGASVHPGQDAYFTEGYCPGVFPCDPSLESFDYNCSGSVEYQYLTVSGCFSPACGPDGFAIEYQTCTGPDSCEEGEFCHSPAGESEDYCLLDCGEEADYHSCIGGGGRCAIMYPVLPRTQGCH